ANVVVQRSCCLIANRGAHEDVLVLLGRVVGDVEEVPRIRNAGRVDSVVQRCPDLRVAAGLPANIRYCCRSVRLIMRYRVARLEPAECAEVVDFSAGSGQFQLLMRRVEVAGVAVKQERRKTGGAVRRCQAYDAAVRVCAVQVRVWSTIDLRALDARGGLRAEIELAAKIAGIHTIEKNFAVVRVASSDEERTLCAVLARLHNKGSRHQTQCAHQVLAQREIERTEHGSGGAGLRLRRRNACGRDHNGLADPLRFEHNIALDGVERAGVKIRRLQLPKAGRWDDEEKAATGPGVHLEASTRGGDRGGNSLLFAYQGDICAGDFGACSIYRYAVNGPGKARSCA